MGGLARLPVTFVSQRPMNVEKAFRNENEMIENVSKARFLAIQPRLGVAGKMFAERLWKT